MRVIWVVLGGAGGLVGGGVIGVGLALLAMTVAPARHDGTFGFREMLVCVPAGALLGVVAGLAWGWSFGAPAP